MSHPGMQRSCSNDAECRILMQSRYALAGGGGVHRGLEEASKLVSYKPDEIGRENNTRKPVQSLQEDL